jgi:thiazole synthase ThiGH ThiG subunit
MARAFKATVEAARDAYEAGLPMQLDHASPTSPLATFLKSST